MLPVDDPMTRCVFAGDDPDVLRAVFLDYACAERGFDGLTLEVVKQFSRAQDVARHYRTVAAGGVEKDGAAASANSQLG